MLANAQEGLELVEVVAAFNRQDLAERKLAANRQTHRGGIAEGAACAGSASAGRHYTDRVVHGLRHLAQH
jgi:hypothetical protein